MAALTTERIRSAAKNLEQDARRIQSDLNSNTILFKLVAEDMEREHDSESVAKLRLGLLEVIQCANRLEYHSSALQNVGETFEANSELTDFSKLLDANTRQALATSPSDPTEHRIYRQFDQAIWNIHHAGEAAPGQEQEEIVMITSQYGVLNHTCPLSGKPVVELEDPVRSTSCHHIYDKASVMDYIRQFMRRRCNCAVVGCPKDLTKDNLICDTALKMEIEELRLRRMANTQTQLVDCAEVDLEDDD